MDKVALIIGHNAVDKGGYSKVLGSEFDYWKKVCDKIKKKIPDMVDIYQREYFGHGKYRKEMQNVLSEINGKEYRYILELHFNCFDGKAEGSEIICYWKNERAKYLGKTFLDLIKAEYETNTRTKWNTLHVDGKKENIKTEGIILVQRDNVRGGYGICHSRGTYILLEPFFGDNTKEANKFEDIEKVAQTFAEFIEEVE